MTQVFVKQVIINFIIYILDLICSNFLRSFFVDLVMLHEILPHRNKNDDDYALLEGKISFLNFSCLKKDCYPFSNLNKSLIHFHL